MAKTFHLVAAALAAVVVCSAAGAQRRGGAVSVRMPSVRLAPAARTSISTFASIAVPRATRQATFIRISPTGRVTSGISTFANSISYGRANGVPGSGFDHAPYAAIGGRLHNNASANFRRDAYSRQTSYVPILIGGYPYYFGDYYADSSDYGEPQQQPQVVTQEPVPVDATQQDVGSGDDSATPSMISSASEPALAVPDVGEFILVRRDGRILFASAFSVAGVQLTYVTPEGIRRTLLLADLDADATQQMNEARGTTVQIHN